MPRIRLLLRIHIVLCLALTTPGTLHSQVGAATGGGDRIEGRVKPLPIPYANYSRSFGWAVGGIPMVLFNPVAADTLSPSSIAGAFGMYTENETWAVGGFTTLYLGEDNWRVQAAGGTGSVNFQFFLDSPVEGWIPYNTAADFLNASVDRKVFENGYLGLGYQYTRFETSSELFPDSVDTRLHGFVLRGSWDRRPSVRYPRGGSVANVKITSFPDWIGNNSGASVVRLDYTHYTPVREARDVLAGRAFAGIGIGDVSFNQQFVVGGTDIRGYSQGEFRGDRVFAVQGEYRWNVLPRIGFVGFLGAAWVFGSLNEEDDGRILPGIGTGLRFTADKETHLNVGLDVAVGRGDWSFSFRFGEAF